MKKIHYLFIIVISTTLFVSCQQSKKTMEPNAVGKYAFNLLKNLQNTTKEAYINSLYTIEELRDYIKKNDKVLSDDMKNEITKLTKEKFNSRIEKDYNQIKEKAIEYGIIWKDIKYMDYTYETKKKQDIEGTQGYLYFKHKDESYKVKVAAFNTGNGHALVEIERLRKVREDNY